ncbi:ROK family protein [Lactiplantibacillus sp. WILCCON 0030]|uniref:ROK family protein n=1 Tax=Lactiplantibacillus brownii TaxID=3069269 RepID=A0ABU1ABA2_9LACO|nr:ROK family protein [Lactiplantibacillus brownii]MDQ7938249.1 ROK family protein [Lactiplantibacillus brownii]
MQSLGLVDIGGTSIKFAIWDGHALQEHHAITTPKNLTDFFDLLTSEVEKMKAMAPIVGVGISAPGAVDKQTGIIGGASAIPYIHNFKIQQELSAKFGLPVSMENDANCAALAELDSGAGAGANSLAFFVVGTGVGGSIIINHRIWHGAHLFGGEFGFTMATATHTVSELGTVPNALRRYQASNPQAAPIDGKQLFELASNGDEAAGKEVQTIYRTLATAIYNIQYSFDPEKIVLGGGVSNNPALIPGIETEIEKIRAQVKIASLKPDVVPCVYTDEANLRGAAVDFEQSYPDLG